MRITPYFTDAGFVQDTGDATCFFDCVEPSRHGFSVTEGRATPHRSDQRTYGKAHAADLFGQRFDVVGGAVDADMRVCKEEIDSVILLSIHFRTYGEGEHGVQIDGGFGIRAFTDQTGPHGVVQFRVIVAHCVSPSCWICYLVFEFVVGDFSAIHGDKSPTTS